MKTYESVIDASVGGVRMQVGGVSAGSCEWGRGGCLHLGWLGTVYKQSTMPPYNCV